MTGYESADLPGMLAKVTAGATGAMGNIVMTGYSSDNLTGMMETYLFASCMHKYM